MATPDEEAELEQSKMSFGEHLEELRRALIKSLLAIVLGFIVGLCIGIPLVDAIQEPLRRELERYYLRRAQADQLEWLQRRQEAGRATPEDLVNSAKEMAQRRLAPHDAYVAPEELLEELAAHYPQLADAMRDGDGAEAPDGAPPEAADRAPGMIRLRLYVPLEDDARLNTIATNSYEPFMVYVKASFAAGLVLASPFVFYYIWEFVAAGLYRSERRYVHIYLPLSLGLFLAGALIAYYFAFEYVLQFLFWFHEKMGIDPYPRLSDWITTVVLLPLAFGVSFQLPLVMLLLQRLGVFSIETYVSKWRFAVVIIAVLAMVLSPGGDVQTMMLMFVPLVGLYFLGIGLCKYMPGGSLRSPLRDLVKRPRAPRKGPEPPPPADQAGS
ncbi:MAG TPA: twin-arginine translocase subunit TatC [Lacipirellulaceae bacterium]|nr:twin-arginine translocase subunit TatC [Lacipirellulaceae bacterium]HMP06813.1 twin-arginine translocase subunit TatC [Lacipirellulaceae bacterium]